MFLVGDLRCFLLPGDYLKPVYTLGAYVLVGAGVTPALAGVGRLRRTEAGAVLGIPRYFVLVPTVSDQYYYLYALTPLTAFLVARGGVRLPERWESRALIAFTLAFLGGWLPGTRYALRHDTVVPHVAGALAGVSPPREMALALLLHDRNYIGGTRYPKYPELFYLAGRSGWNVRFPVEGRAMEGIVEQVQRYRREGGRWLVVTWYSPDEESWFAPLIPQRFERRPRVDGAAVAKTLAARYPLAELGPNHEILRLG